MDLLALGITVSSFIFILLFFLINIWMGIWTWDEIKNKTLKSVEVLKINKKPWERLGKPGQRLS